jgi:ketosteroid isomerase-like protein
MTNSCVSRRRFGKILGHAVCGCFAVMLLASGCNQAPPPVDLKAAADAVRAADAAQLKSAQALDAAGVIAEYADDAVVLPPNEPAATDKASILKLWTGMMVPGTAVTWTATRIEVAASGDLAYEQGAYSVTGPGPDGKPMSETGKILSVWKKQTDGSWKSVEDMWNSDLPAVAPMPVKAKKGK